MKPQTFKSMCIAFIVFTIVNAITITMAFNDIYFGPNKIHFLKIQGGFWLYLICIILLVTIVTFVLIQKYRKIKFEDIQSFKESIIRYKWWVIFIYIGLVILLILNYSVAIFLVPIVLMVLNPWTFLILLCFLM